MPNRFYALKGICLDTVKFYAKKRLCLKKLCPKEIMPYESMPKCRTTLKKGHMEDMNFSKWSWSSQGLFGVCLRSVLGLFRTSSWGQLSRHLGG